MVACYQVSPWASYKTNPKTYSQTQVNKRFVWYHWRLQANGLFFKHIGCLHLNEALHFLFDHWFCEAWIPIYRSTVRMSYRVKTQPPQVLMYSIQARVFTSWRDCTVHMSKLDLGNHSSDDASELQLIHWLFCWLIKQIAKNANPNFPELTLTSCFVQNWQVFSSIIKKDHNKQKIFTFEKNWIFCHFLTKITFSYLSKCCRLIFCQLTNRLIDK